MQLLIQEISKKPFEDFAQENIYTPLQLKSTFFVSSKNAELFETKMATGYDDEGNPIPGKFPVIPEIVKAFVAALNGENQLLLSDLARDRKNLVLNGL